MRDRTRHEPTAANEDLGSGAAGLLAAREWERVRVRDLAIRPYLHDRTDVVRVETVVHLGRLTPADVCVELSGDERAGIPDAGRWALPMHVGRSYRNGTFVFDVLVRAPFPSPSSEVTVRVRPNDRRQWASVPPPVTRSFSWREAVGVSSAATRGKAR